MLRMRRVTTAWVGLLLITALVVPALLIPRTAQAQDPTPVYDWIYDYDYTASQQGWSISQTHPPAYNGTWNAGTGFVSTWVSGLNANSLYIALAWPTTAHIVRIAFTYTITGAPTDVPSFRAWDVVGGGTLQCSVTGSNAAGSHTIDSSTTCLNAKSWLFAFNGRYNNHTDAIAISHLTVWGVDATPYTPTPTNTPTITPTATNTPLPTQPPSGACVSTWTRVYNFTQSAGGWTNRPAHDGEGIQDSSGFHTVPSTVDGYTGFSEHLVIQRAVGYATSETVISGINLDVTYNAGDAGSPDIRAIQVLNGSTVLIDDAHPPTSGQKNLSWTGSSAGGTFYIEVYASGVLQGGANNGSATINSISFTGAGIDPDGNCESTAPSTDATSWAYPIASGDRSQSESIVPLSLILPPVVPISGFSDIPFEFQRSDLPETYDQRAQQGAIALFGHSATGDGINVHSMTDGTVAEIRTLSHESGQCIGVDLLRQWPAYTCQSFIGGSERFFDYGSAYLIKIDTGAAFLYYMVANTALVEGQDVTKGCIIGQGLNFYLMTITGSVPIGGSGYIQKSNDVYTMVWARDESGAPFDLIPYLREEPQNIRCAGGGGGAGAGGCAYVHDPYFFFDSQDNPWQAMGGGTQHRVGEISGLWLRDATSQGLNLDTTHQYTISVAAHLINPASGPAYRMLPEFDSPHPAAAVASTVYDFTVQLGANTASTITVSSTTSETTNIAADTYLPLGDAGYLLNIAPTSHTQDNIVVDFVCVSDTDSGMPAPSGGCLLLNPEFETPGNWTLTDGGNGLPIISNAVVYVPHDSSIAQSLTLHPKDSGAQNYTLTITANRQGVPATGKSVSFDWSYSSANGTIGPYTDNTFRDGTDTFSVTTNTTATLTITTNASDADQVGIIDAVCVTTSDGADPPGYQPPGAPGLTATCKTCTYTPVGDVNYDLPGVIAWLMCGISQIWNCQMKQILYGIWQVVTNILMFMALARAWTALTITQLATWANADLRIFASWLNGELANLQTSLTGLIASWGPHDNGGGTNLWDALVALFNGLRDVLTRLIDAILSLATVLLELIGQIVGLIINFLIFVVSQFVNLIQTLINLILSALNAPPSPPAGIPVCDDSADLIYENCLPIFIIDNTILADNTPFGFLLPFIEGSAGFALLWWGIGKIKAAITGGNDS